MIPMRVVEVIYAIMLLAAMLSMSAQGAATKERDQSTPETRWVYFGTYTGGTSKGIYRARFDPGTGRLSVPEVAAEVASPAFLAWHPEHPYLYAVNEVQSFEGRPGGAVSAFEQHPETGELRLLNQESSRGGGPCHLSVDHAGQAVLVANYGGGSIAALPIGPDGRLAPAAAVIQHSGSSVNRQRQNAPHAHGIYVDAANAFVFVPDLGIDQVLIYRWNPRALDLQAHQPPAAVLPAGSGPRHFVFHPGGQFAYVINELLNTVTAFAYDGSAGTLRTLQTIGTLPADYSGKNSTAEIVVHPSGNYLYGSNRGHDSLATYRIEPTGHLRLIGHTPTGGRTPRNFATDPIGNWILVANQDSNNVVVFKVEDGLPQPTGHTIEVPTPVCVLFK